MPMQGSAMTRICDLGLGIVLPFHSHVSLNAVVSDYVPYAWRSALQPMPMAAVIKLLAFHRPAAFQMYRRKLVLGRECSRVDALLSHCCHIKGLAELADGCERVSCSPLTAGPARFGLMGASAVATLGLLKLNLLGPGITDTVRSFWRYPKPPKAEPKQAAKSGTKPGDKSK